MASNRDINHALREIRLKTRSRMIAEVSRHKVEFSPLEHVAMSNIRELGGASQQMLVEAMQKDKTQVSRIIGRLHRQDLIIKQPDPFDKRSVNLTLSDSGETLLNSLDKVETEMVENMLQGFESQEVDTLCDLLTRLNNNLK